jgi:hypothetical protein
MDMTMESDTPRTLSVNASAFRDDGPGLTNTDITDTMVTTVVSNGNDALNLLFEAAQREERDVNSVRGSASIDQASPLLTLSPTSPSMGARANLLPDLSPEQLEVWNAYRFVRMGWLSAEEVVWLLNMYVSNVNSKISDQFLKVLPKYCAVDSNTGSM